MKTQFLVLLTGFVISCLFASGQTNPQKGYYSIQKNSEKLGAKKNIVSDLFKTGTVINRPKTSKGYYAIGNNKGNVSNTKSIVVKTADSATRRQVRPVIKKGYYSIGRNAEKL